MTDDGLKSNGTSWRAHLANMQISFFTTGFLSSLAVLDVWFHPAMKTDRTKYQTYQIFGSTSQGMILL